MSSIELIITAIGLAMDAFAVALCKGLSSDKVKVKDMAVVGIWFGGFQGLMPLIGYLIGSTFAKYIESVDHWVAFGLLAIIGINMLRESFKKDDCCCEDASLGFTVMLTMALATSIDALAVGVGFAMLPDFDIVFAVISIALITFTLSALGVKLGRLLGAKYKTIAERTGGVVLILMGFKILFEHLGVIDWVISKL